MGRTHFGAPLALASRMAVTKILLSFVLALSFASTSIASSFGRLPLRTIASVSVSDPSTGAEEALASEIDRQADVVFQNFLAESGSRIPLTVLQKAKRIAVYRLKQMHVLTDVLKAAGPAPATTLLAAELLTNFVLAPIATAFGKPVVAGVMVTVPWGVIGGFGVFSFQVMKERFKMARELGRYSLRSLDRLRADMLGYDVKHRVSSVIYHELSEMAEFEVLSKGWKLNSARMPGLLVSDLETLVRESPDGGAYLDTIHMERLDPAFYTSLLLRFINHSPTLVTALVAKVRASTPAIVDAGEASSLRRHLIGVDDVKSQVERSLSEQQKIKAGLKKRLKSGEITVVQRDRLKAGVISEVNRLREVKAQLARHEYAVLVDSEGMISNGQKPTSVSVDRERAEDLLSLALEAHVQPPVSSVVEVGASRSASAEGVKTALKAVSARALVCRDLFY